MRMEEGSRIAKKTATTSLQHFRQADEQSVKNYQKYRDIKRKTALALRRSGSIKNLQIELGVPVTGNWDSATDVANDIAKVVSDEVKKARGYKDADVDVEVTVEVTPPDLVDNEEPMEDIRDEMRYRKSKDLHNEYNPYEVLSDDAIMKLYMRDQLYRDPEDSSQVVAIMSDFWEKKDRFTKEDRARFNEMYSSNPQALYEYASSLLLSVDEYHDEVPLFYQNRNDPWSDIMFGQSTISDGGCSIMAMTMALSVFDPSISIFDAYDFALGQGNYEDDVKNAYRRPPNPGVNPNFWTDMPAHFGINVEKIDKADVKKESTEDVIKEALKSGGSVVLRLDPSNDFSDGNAGHYVTVVGFKDGEYIVHNPAYHEEDPDEHNDTFSFDELNEDALNFYIYTE